MLNLGFEYSVNNSSVLLAWETEKINLAVNHILTSLLLLLHPCLPLAIEEVPENENQKESVGSMFISHLKLNKEPLEELSVFLIPLQFSSFFEYGAQNHIQFQLMPHCQVDRTNKISHF